MKVAKLVAVSFLTRVIVEENATEEEVLEKAKSNFAFKIEDELSENLEYIVDDIECPYNEKYDL